MVSRSLSPVCCPGNLPFLVGSVSEGFAENKMEHADLLSLKVSPIRLRRLSVLSDDNEAIGEMCVVMSRHVQSTRLGCNTSVTLPFCLPKSPTIGNGMLDSGRPAKLHRHHSHSHSSGASAACRSAYSTFSAQAEREHFLKQIKVPLVRVDFK